MPLGTPRVERDHFQQVRAQKVTDKNVFAEHFQEFVGACDRFRQVQAQTVTHRNVFAGARNHFVSEAVACPANTFLRVTFVARIFLDVTFGARTCWKWWRAPANTFLRVSFCARTAGSGRGPGEHIFACHSCPNLLAVVTGPGKHILVRHFLRPDLLEVVAGPGEHTFARHFLHPYLLKVVAGPGEHIFARHLLHPDLMEVVAGCGKHIFAFHLLRRTCCSSACALLCVQRLSLDIFVRQFLRWGDRRLPAGPGAKSDAQKCVRRGLLVLKIFVVEYISKKLLLATACTPQCIYFFCILA